MERMTPDGELVEVLVLTEGTWRVLERWHDLEVSGTGSTATVHLPSEVEQQTPLLVGWRASAGEPPERYRFGRVVLSRCIDRHNHEALLAWLPMPQDLANQPWAHVLRKPA